jgi:hypothetical protein
MNFKEPTTFADYMKLISLAVIGKFRRESRTEFLATWKGSHANAKKLRQANAYAERQIRISLTHHPDDTNDLTRFKDILLRSRAGFGDRIPLITLWMESSDDRLTGLQELIKAVIPEKLWK